MQIWRIESYLIEKMFFRKMQTMKNWCFLKFLDQGEAKIQFFRSNYVFVQLLRSITENWKQKWTWLIQLIVSSLKMIIIAGGVPFVYP